MSNKEGRGLVAFLRQTHHNQRSEAALCHIASCLLRASVMTTASQVVRQQIAEQYSYSTCHANTDSDTKGGKKKNKIKDSLGSILPLQ